MPITKHGVAEIFGYKVDSEEPEAIKSRGEYTCPLLGRRCKKKSEYRDLDKNIPFGVCSVWKRGKDLNSIPHIICPIRFEQNQTIFKDAAKLLGHTDEEEIVIVPELSINAFGRVDYIVTKRNISTKKILDFVLLEVMALSTTGTGQIILSMLDALNNTNRASNKYGINYRQVISRLIVQGIVKAEACKTWNKSMIWAIQDVLFEYMEKTTKLHLTPIPEILPENGQRFPVFFYVYNMKHDEKTNSFIMTLSSIYGGTITSMLQMLNGQTIPKIETIEKAINLRIENTESKLLFLS